MIDNHQYYPTPEALSIKAWETFKNRQFVRVLEPSAGEGHLLKPRPYNRWQQIPVDCIEIDISKHPILRSQGYSVVGMDFMQFKSGSLYSHVLMNPPFADGAQHVLKAWEILFDGEIVAILNAETLKNPFSKERKHLVRLIEQFGEVEYLSAMFTGQDAERKTDVEIALVWLKKTSTFEEELLGNILDDLRRDQASAGSLAGDCQPIHELALANAFIDNAVLMFNAAVEAARQSAFSEARAMRYRKMLGQTLGELNGDAAIKSTHTTLDWVKNQLYTDYSDLKDRAWSGILRSTQVTARLSSAAQKRLESDFETIKSLEFTVANIYGFLQGIIDQQGDIQLSMVCDVFDLITRYHSDNTVFFMGWKSNDKHRTLGMRIKTTRFVIPGHATESYQNDLSWESQRMLADFDKVFAMLDGKYEAAIGLESVFRNHFHALRTGQRISGSYFDVRYYPGVGTIHFFPSNKTLIDRMNRLVGNHRRWLPPAETKAGTCFWQQFDDAEKLDKAFRTEVSKHCKRDGRRYHFDPFWAIKYGGESEREHGHAMLTEAMSTVLANHGINPDILLDSDQNCVRQLDWDGLPDSHLALAS